MLSALPKLRASNAFPSEQHSLHCGRECELNHPESRALLFGTESWPTMARKNPPDRETADFYRKYFVRKLLSDRPRSYSDATFIDAQIRKRVGEIIARDDGSQR